MTISLEKLVQSVANGTVSTLIEDPNNISPDLASSASALFEEAAGRGDVQVAFSAALGASLVWQRLGEPSQELSNFINAQQVKYMADETVESYMQTRSTLQDAYEMGLQIDDRRLAFRAGTVAADCAFWASQAASGLDGEDLILKTLDDLLQLKPLVNPENRVDYERFVSLLSAAGTTAAERYMGEKTDLAHEKLRALVAMADEVIPVDFAYETGGGAEKTAHTANALAGLSEFVGQ